MRILGSGNVDLVRPIHRHNSYTLCRFRIGSLAASFLCAGEDLHRKYGGADDDDGGGKPDKRVRVVDHARAISASSSTMLASVGTYTLTRAVLLSSPVLSIWAS